MLLFAQALGEYAGVGSNVPLSGSMDQFGSNLWHALRGIDQQTWLILGGVLLALVVLTRRSKRS